MPSTNLDRFALAYFKKFCGDNACQYIDSLIVSTYLLQHNITIEENLLLRQHCLNYDESLDLQEYISYLNKRNIILNIEDIVEFFEFVISPKDKEINGAIYTPKYIREYIIGKIITTIPQNEWQNKTFGDISCGCGGFFLTIAEKLYSIGCPFSEIYANNIYGVDIQAYSINRTKLLLSLLAISHGEDVQSYDFNLYIGNSLCFDWNINDTIRDNGGFDFIVGNPPYIGSSKMDDESKELIKNWSVSSSGKADMYIPFFQIAIENLVENGILGYITVNNFYRSLNGRCLREYFSQNQFDLKVIDFGAEQVFKRRSTYTCVCFVHRNNLGSISYVNCKSRDIQDLQGEDYIAIEYVDVSNHKGWILKDKTTTENINIIENTGHSLGDLFDIKNGFATLKNNIYLFTPIKEDCHYYYFIKDDNNYKVEKNICRDAVKPNILKTDTDIENNIEKLIFPYIVEPDGKVVLISEESMKNNYMCAYGYLECYKEILHKRDKGSREYPAWYAYGRTQALNISGYKLLFPYISNKPYFVLSQQTDLLFYNGYAIVSDSIFELQVLQKVLISDIFWYYIKHISKPYGGDYYALAKNYVKNFGIINMSIREKQSILDMDEKSLEKFLLKKYFARNRKIIFT